MKKNVFFFLIFSFNFLNSFSPIRDYKLFKAYQNEDYKNAKEFLQDMQVEVPLDPVINYNLGTVTYKLHDFESSQANFDRAAEHSGNNLKLKEQSFFNSANSFYKNCLSVLGDDWEKKDVSDDVLQQSIEQIKSAIERYKNSLVVNSKNENAKNNLKLSEELLSKLEKKKQDKQQNKDDKDQDKKDKDKKQDKNKQGKKDQQERKDDKNKDQDKQKEDKQVKQDEKQEKNDKQEQQDNKNEQDKEDEKNREQQDQEKKEYEQQEESQVNTGQGQEQEEDVDMKENAMRAILVDLQEDEAKLQKQLIKDKTSSKNKLSKGQKPW